MAVNRHGPFPVVGRLDQTRLLWLVRNAGTNGKSGDGRPCVLLSQAKVVSHLEGEPEPCRHAEPMAEAERGIARNALLAFDDPAEPVRRHLDLAG